MTRDAMRPPQISASILNSSFDHLGEEVRRAAAAGVDSIHLDVMDGHFVPNLTLGPMVVEAVRPRTTLPFHSHLMISEPLRYLEVFARAGSDLLAFHVEADGDPGETIARIHALGRGAGLALNPETPAEAAFRYLGELEIALVMTVQPGFGGQEFLRDMLGKVTALRAEAERRRLDLPIGVDGGVNEETIGVAYRAGSDLLVVGSGLYRHDGDLTTVVDGLRASASAAAQRGSDSAAARA